MILLKEDGPLDIYKHEYLYQGGQNQEKRLWAEFQNLKQCTVPSENFDTLILIPQSLWSLDLKQTLE